MNKPSPQNQATRLKLERILNSVDPLVREDVIWILEFIKKKAVEEDPELLGLTQPRLLKNFRYFAETALMLIHQSGGVKQETDRLKHFISEATYGLNNTKS